MADKTQTVEKKKRVQKPRSQFVVLQVLDEAGQPMVIAKDRIKIITATRNAAELLDSMESGQYPNAVYKKVQTVA